MGTSMWNYRIIKDNDDSYGLYEVIYNDDGEISAHSEKPEAVAESPKDLLVTLKLMLEDAQKSYYNILEADKIKFAPLCDESELENAVPYEYISNLENEN